MSKKNKEEQKPKKKSKFYRFTFFLLILSILLFNVLNIFLKSYVLILSIILVLILFVFQSVVKKMNVAILNKIVNIIYIFLILISVLLNFSAFLASKNINNIEQSRAKSNSVNVKSEPFNILLTGVDTRKDNQTLNSDTIMLVTVDPFNEKVLLTSIPRDTYVQLTCTNEFDKLTHASSFNDECLINTVETLLDTKINYFIRFDFNSVIDLVDDLGGIYIDIESDFCGQDENDKKESMCFKKGNNKLNGKETLSYIRERKSFSNGDYARTEHQQKVVLSYFNTLKKHPFKINKIITTASKSIVMNFDKRDINNLIELFIFNDFKFESNTIKGEEMIVDIDYEGLKSVSVQLLDPFELTMSKYKIGEIIN